jgi:putative Mg2+ transporter-C (MgtC) family protein
VESVWSEIAGAFAAEFTDLPDAASATRLVVRLGIAAVLGGALGYERELRGKDAGLRTHMLICVGAALFVAIPQQAGFEGDPLSRVIQGIVAGIGFLGGGAILKLEGERRIEGLTTASGIWLTCAIGISAGLGRELSALVGTAIALFVTASLSSLSRRLERSAEARRARDGED